MRIIDLGAGTPIVLIPGIQGRWAYMRRAVEALAASFRVVTFDLCGERGCGDVDPSKGLDSFVEQIEQVLDERGIRQAVVCGVSFGGLIALRFAAERPERTRALMLVSTPGPGFALRPRHRFYMRLPWLFGPLFLAEIPRRLHPELVLAIPDALTRRRFAWQQVKTVVQAPISLSRMAVRARLIGHHEPRDDCRRILVPTLVVTGEPGVDYVVPTDQSMEYARLIPGAQSSRLERTGHLGYITRPAAFAAAVRTFLESDRARRGPVGEHDAA